MASEPLASATKDGRMYVVDNDGFAASSRDGGRTWASGLKFRFDDQDDFFAVPAAEAVKLASAARTSLSVAPDRSNALS